MVWVWAILIREGKRVPCIWSLQEPLAARASLCPFAHCPALSYPSPLAASFLLTSAAVSVALSSPQCRQRSCDNRLCLLPCAGRPVWQPADGVRRGIHVRASQLLTGLRSACAAIVPLDRSSLPRRELACPKPSSSCRLAVGFSALPILTGDALERNERRYLSPDADEGVGVCLGAWWRQGGHGLAGETRVLGRACMHAAG